MLLLGGFLLLSELLLHKRTLTDLLSSMSVGNEEGFGELGKVVVDMDL
jgi:hypothetical protein